MLLFCLNDLEMLYKILGGIMLHDAGFGAFVVSVLYSFVVSVNKSFHVFITAVAYTYVMSVKKFRKLVVWREGFVNKL